MKKVLVYSLVLVLLTVLLDLETTEKQQAASQYSDTTGAIDVLAFSTGENLPPYDYLRGQIGLDNTILVEELVLKSTENTQGMWVALFDQDFELMSHKCFNLGEEPADMVAFLKHFSSRPIDSTAVLSLQGTVHAGKDAGRADFSSNLAGHSVHAGYFDPGLPAYRKLLGGTGWMAPEIGSGRDNTYAWSNGPQASFALWLGAPADGIIALRGYGISDGGEPRHLYLSLNGQSIGKQPLPKKSGVMLFPVSGDVLNPGLNWCELKTERTVSPFQAKRGADDRHLGFLVDFVKYQATSDSLRPPVYDPHPNNHELLGGKLDPGLPGDAGQFQPSEWYPREKGENGIRYAWTRNKQTHCKMTVQDPGPGTIVVTGYGVGDGQGDRFLTVHAGDTALGRVVVPENMAEMRFSVPRRIGSREELDLVLELDRLTSGPGDDARILGLLVAGIRFERSNRPPFDPDQVAGTFWLHSRRPVFLPVGSLSGSKLHLGWQTGDATGSPTIIASIVNQLTGQEIFREQMGTSGVSDGVVVLPENIPEKALLHIGIPGAIPGQGLQLTRVVLEFASSEEIAGLFASLGAQARPWLDEGASWTLVSTNRPGGWVPLSESYSLTSGVMSAVTIVPDRSRYDGFTGNFRRID